MKGATAYSRGNQEELQRKTLQMPEENLLQRYVDQRNISFA
jgi:hypothetical protein